MNEQDLNILDRYEYTHKGYYQRALIKKTKESDIYYYQPAKNLLDAGELGKVWDIEKVDSSLEVIYEQQVVPKFKAENRDLFESRVN